MYVLSARATCSRQRLAEERARDARRREEHARPDRKVVMAARTQASRRLT